MYYNPQLWASDFYKLVGYKMTRKEAQELIFALEYCKGKSNNNKLENIYSKGNVRGNGCSIISYGNINYD